MGRKGYQRQSDRGSGSNRVRVIGGRWRGRQLRFPSAPGLRPTADRVRETLFNWLQGTLEDARVLDLFAGSGALGIEAASRGAAHVTLVESHHRAAQALREHATTLQAANLHIVQRDALRWLDDHTPEVPFDLVLLDPPFDAHLHRPVLSRLLEAGMLHDHSRVYCEYPSADEPPFDAAWELLREARAGDASAALLRPACAPAREDRRETDV